MTHLLIGDGRLATSLAAWLPARGIKTHQWSRRLLSDGKCQALWAMARLADTVLIAIKDDAIVLWTEENRALLEGKTLVHFSGALTAEGISSMHPLYAFPPEPVPARMMDSIPFICDDGEVLFRSAFPGCSNPNFILPSDKRALYHALAVLSGNLSTYLWNQSASTAWDEFGFPPRDVFGPYFSSLIRNFENSPFDSLTGPVKRRDMDTIDRNLQSLENYPNLERLYRAFVDTALGDD